MERERICSEKKHIRITAALKAEKAAAADRLPAVCGNHPHFSLGAQEEKKVARSPCSRR